MNYNWDIVKWIKLVLGSLWKPNRALLIKCLLQPIIRMYNEFIILIDDINNRTRYNSSQKALTSLLNKLFDPTLKRIYIDTVADEYQVYYQPIIGESLGDMVPLYQPIIADTDTPAPLYQLNIAEYILIVDFIVYVPTSLAAQEGNIKAWVNYYRFASLTFKIIYI